MAEFKDEMSERGEDLKEGAKEWAGDVKTFWNIDRKSLLITISASFIVGFIIGALIY